MILGRCPPNAAHSSVASEWFILLLMFMNLLHVLPRYVWSEGVGTELYVLLHTAKYIKMLFMERRFNIYSII